jgi:hypothetical protein
LNLRASYPFPNGILLSEYLALPASLLLLLLLLAADAAAAAAAAATAAA